MEILNYKDAPAGSKHLGEFEIYIPSMSEILTLMDSPMTIRKVRLIRSKHGGHFAALPAFKENLEPDGKWFRYVDFSKEKLTEIEKMASEAVKPFVNH